VPAFGTLYQRLTLPESEAFLKTRNQQDPESATEDQQKTQTAEDEKAESTASDSNSEPETLSKSSPGNSAHFKGQMACVLYMANELITFNQNSLSTFLSGGMPKSSSEPACHGSLSTSRTH
jgi:hypothetical protein